MWVLLSYSHSDGKCLDCKAALDVTEAASAAADGALKAGGEIGGQAVNQVRKALTGTISGVKVVLKEPFKKDNKAQKKKG